MGQPRSAGLKRGLFYGLTPSTRDACGTRISAQKRDCWPPFTNVTSIQRHVIVSDELTIDVNWLGGQTGSALDRAFYADIALAVNGEWLTLLEDLEARTVRRHLRGCGHHLAVWFASNWWRYAAMTQTRLLLRSSNPWSRTRRIWEARPWTRWLLMGGAQPTK